MSKKLFTLGSSTLVVAIAIAFSQVSSTNPGTVFCSCPSGLAFATELPMSHPINRCASEQVAGVSWLSWLSGQSNSYQFHFLDLLELLSRQAETFKDKSPT
ncbi:hypothetical protein [Paraglaciecola sp.]|uniref:hypothetical protein n=1 Tax=Paraglaciecola sp. TaxID=1920173 RepID=UPI0030F4A73E